MTLGTAAVAAIVGSVKGSLGKFKATLQAGVKAEGPVARLLRKIAPWVGSFFCVALLVGFFCASVASAAYSGPRVWPHWAWVGICLVGIVVWQLVTDVNRNSVHPFYRERLSSAYFAVERDGTGTAAKDFDYSQPLSLSRYKSPPKGTASWPELVVCAAVNTDEEGVAPAGRNCAPFTFSPQSCGIPTGTMFGYAQHASRFMLPTEDYERLAGTRVVTLPGVVAVSGAAVSPAMGRMNRAPLRLLLGLANVRLGLWLPNPMRPDRTGAPSSTDKQRFSSQLRWQWKQPGIKALLKEALGRTSLNGRWVYVTDGGHYENLGLVEALRRGATEIVVFDASGDTVYSWSTLGRAVETARADLGIEINLNPSSMQPVRTTPGVASLVEKGTFTFPNGAIGDLYYCKLARPVEASWDVIAWAKGHPDFPHDSTAHQLYGDEEFEAYRALGQLAAGASNAAAHERGEGRCSCESQRPGGQS